MKEVHDTSNDEGFVKAKTMSLTSRTTVLVNDTNKTLHLRDKVGPAYGGTRYTIPANKQIEVSPLQHTFFKMIAYAVEEQENSSIDTRLTIDSDQLADNKKISITYTGSAYKIQPTPR